MKLKEFKNGKKVSKEEIENWEKNNNIFLPDDYKNFLINIGTGNTSNFYSDYDAIAYINKLKEEEYYETDDFFNLNEIIENNEVFDNYNINKSSLLVFAKNYSFDSYSICIDKNSKNYGKIYYNVYFIYLKSNKNSYEKFPCLENNFNNFLENIELLKEA